jgi:hypothetical protein
MPAVDEIEYPALYQAASDASARAQRAYLRCVKAYAYLSVGGAGVAIYGIESKEIAFLAGALFLLGLFVAVLMAVKKYENTWYRTRAIAESIKTTTWRFMMHAEPFEGLELAEAKHKLSSLLQQILQEHRDLATELGGQVAALPQFSDRMLQIRGGGFADRLATYVEDRIKEQRKWYADKSASNIAQGRAWFWSFVVVQGLAVTFTLSRIAWPAFKAWPIPVLVVAAGSILGWIQLKRYRELGAAYGVTAHEIGFAEAAAPNVASADALAHFVRDVEGVFSREHTQWVAKRAQ